MIGAWLGSPAGRPALGHALLAALAACGEPGAVVHDGPVPPRLPVLAGGAAEVNVDVPAASQVTAVFAAAAPLAWDVHVHRGDQVEIREQGTGASGTLTIAPETGGAYSLLWQNPGEADLELDLDLTLAGGASVISWSTR